MRVFKHSDSSVGRYRRAEGFWLGGRETENSLLILISYYISEKSQARSRGLNLVNTVCNSLDSSF